MKEKTIYRSAEGKTKILTLYDEIISRLGIEHEDIYLETRYGSTHVLAIGPKEGPPMIFFHGGNSLNPFDLKKFTPLANKYRIYTLDTIGHPGKSSEYRLSPKDNSYGEWAIDVLDGLKLEQSAFVGSSFGGGILLQIASFAPERISAAAFIVPSGFANGSSLSIIRKLVIPLIKYRISPTRKNFERTVLPLVGHLDDDLVEMSLLTISNLKVAS
ncbi:MAG: alpha/beta fold hydrolase [Candidatus Lokiarchaeota archaeon]|nr:alpha/beta fold hydrolase [Candidatus Lokiarchaeota archaeon]